MPIHTRFIDNSIDIPNRTSFLKKAVRIENKDFTDQRIFHNWELTEMLETMEYKGALLKDLVKYIQESVAHAYDRGIFVVCHRVLGHRYSDNITNARQLLRALRNKELETFTAHLWYNDNCYKNAMKNARYGDDIIAEIEPFILKHVRRAFTAGMLTACKSLAVSKEKATDAHCPTVRAGGYFEHIMMGRPQQ
jgi:hypothetical protein